MVAKRKPKRKIAPTKRDGTAVLLHVDENMMARLNRFQQYMKTEQAMNLKNAPSCMFLINQGLKDFETKNKQLDLIGEIEPRKKRK